MSDHVNRVSIRTYTAAALRDTVDGGALLREQEPRHGDYIVIRCHPSRTRTIEYALRCQLAPYGAGSGVDGDS